MTSRRLGRTVFGCGLLLVVGLAAPDVATAIKVPFTSGVWVLRNAEISPHLGRSALAARPT